jgi:hypothetical protein
VPVAIVFENGADEDCNGVDERYPVLPTTVRQEFAVFAGFTKVRQLLARNVPAGATVELRCTGRGCPFSKRSKTLQRAAARLDLVKAFKLGKVRLKPKAKLQVRVTAPDAVGTLVVITVRDRKLPNTRRLCLWPGAGKGSPC